MSLAIGLGWRSTASSRRQESYHRRCRRRAVVDGKGNAVLDFAAEDFELSETAFASGLSPQPWCNGVSCCHYRSAVRRRATSQAASTQSASPASRPEGAIPPSVTAILFDRLSPESRALARRAALAYVSTLTPPHDYAGVFLADLPSKPFSRSRTSATSSHAASILVSATCSGNTALAAEPESKRVYGLDPNPLQQPALIGRWRIR